MQCDVVDATTWRAFVGRASDLSDDRESGASTRPGLRCQQGVGSDRSVKIELLRLTVAATKKRSVSPKKLSRAIVGGLRLVLDSQTDVSDLDPSDVKHADARLPVFSQGGCSGCKIHLGPALSRAYLARFHPQAPPKLA